MGTGTSTVRARTFSGRRGSQDALELQAFIDVLLAEGVRSYGEIGAREGDTFHAVMSALPKGSRGAALDLPGGLWGKDTTRGNLELAVADLCGKGYVASCLFGDSATAATIRQFKARGPFDAILIDGDHRLPGVTADWRNYRSMARIIAFHDIDGDGQTERGGAKVEVPLLWQSIRDEFRTSEFITPDSHMGIGIVWF